jgi:hypothetical protein
MSPLDSVLMVASLAERPAPMLLHTSVSVVGSLAPPPCHMAEARGGSHDTA